MLATKEKSHPGFQLSTVAPHPGFAFAISNTATEFDASVYDFCSGSLSSGYFRDSETGLDYAINRYHQPGMGRFMTPDPKRRSARPRSPGSWNRYAYTRGDPVNRIDRRGHDDCSADKSVDDCDDYEDDGDDGGGGDVDDGEDPQNQNVTMSQATQQSELDNGLNWALEALQNPQCVFSLFNYVPGSVAPAQVLQQLISSGNVQFGSIADNNTGATTQVIIGAPGQPNSASITLNDNLYGLFSMGTNSYGL